MNKIKLIIWDFDGVIADTEKLWLNNRRTLLNKHYGIDWDYETANQYLGGISDKTKKIRMTEMGYQIKDEFWDLALVEDYKTMAQGIDLMPGVKDIFEMPIKQCIATGGIRSKTRVKLETVGINKLFDETRVFTADMVEHGKPEPQLFLLAAETMGEKPENCVVIEDSIAGMTAGLRAGMTTVAFIGGELNNNQENIANIKKLGINMIFDKMSDFKEFILKNS